MWGGNKEEAEAAFNITGTKTTSALGPLEFTVTGRLKGCSHQGARRLGLCGLWTRREDLHLHDGRQRQSTGRAHEVCAHTPCMRGRDGSSGGGS